MIDERSNLRVVLRAARAVCLLPCLALWWSAPLAADDSREARALLERARGAHGAGKRGEALALYLEALERFRRLSDGAGAAVCLNNAAVVLYDDGDYERSFAMAREAIRLRRDLGDLRLVGRSLTNSGRALQQLGRLEEAEADFREALASARAAGDQRDMVINGLNLGVLAQARGLYGRALSAIRSALDLIDASTHEPWARQQRIIALNNRGALHERIGEYRLALADYEELFRIGGEGVESIPYLVNSAAILRNLGDADLALRRLAEAETILASAGGDPGLHANLLSNTALVLHRNLHRFEAARERLERALAMGRAAAEPQEEMTIGNLLGAVYLDLGLVDEAARAYGRVLERLERVPILEPAWEAHLGMARVFDRRGDRATALRALWTAAALIEGSRLDLALEIVPRRFLADRLEVYAMLSSVLAAPGDAESVREGLRAVERARQRLLLARWRRSRREEAGPAAPEPWHSEPAALSAAAARLYGEASPADLSAWQEIHDRWAGWTRAEPLSSAPPGEAFVEYLIVADRSRVYWLTAAGAGTLALPDEREIQQRAEEWLDDLVGGPVGGAREIERGRALYEMVLAPVLGALPPGVRRVRIVPDGALWRVPLDVLPDGSTAPGGSAGRLLHRHEVVLSLLLSEPPAAEAPAPEIPYVYFGAPEAPQQPAGGGPDPFSSSLPDLPGARAELEPLRRALGGGGVAFAGREAREADFRKAVRNRLGILHVATHALVDPLDAGRAGIVLSGEQEGGLPPEEDGFLSLPEIRGLHLRTDLAFLSACSGGVGERLPGEGLDSLAGAFLEAGSGAVVASLWDVEDLPTRALVEQFYDRLGRGESFAAALRHAKLALLDAGGEIARPRHWAGWVLVGDGERSAPRSGPERRTRAVLLIAFAGLAAAALVARLRRRVSPRY